MTTKHVVADDVLGKISRRVWELNRRILEGSVDAERVLEILQLAIEGVPKPYIQEGCSWGTYILESHWAFDNFHCEFATIGIEKCDSIAPEDILNPSVPREKKEWLLKHLKRIFDGQVPQHGSYKMVRLYRVLRTDYFGYEPGWGTQNTTGWLKREAVDMHFTLRPICDFDDNGEPIPCEIDPENLP